MHTYYFLFKGALGKDGQPFPDAGINTQGKVAKNMEKGQNLQLQVKMYM